MAPGLIALTCTGMDSVLGCDVSGVYWYQVKDAIPIRHWTEVITRTKLTAAKEGGRAAVDLGKWQEYEALDPTPK